MNTEMTNEADQRREAPHNQQEVVRVAYQAHQEHLRPDATQSRETVRMAARDVDRRGDNVAQDAQRTAGADLGEPAQQWLDTSRDLLRHAQDTAQAFFRIVEASLESVAHADPQLAELGSNAARALESFAGEMQRESELLTQEVTQALDNGQVAQAQDAFDRSSRAADIARDRFDEELSDLNARVENWQVEERREEASHEAEDADRRREEQRQGEERREEARREETEGERRREEERREEADHAAEIERQHDQERREQMERDRW